MLLLVKALDDYHKKNKRVYGVLHFCLGKDHQHHAETAAVQQGDGAALWAWLHREFCPRTPAHQQVLRHELLGLDRKQFATSEAYVNAIRRLLARLKAAGSNVEQDQQSALVKMKADLHDSHLDLVRRFYGRAQDLDGFIETLLSEDRDMEELRAVAATAAGQGGGPQAFAVQPHAHQHQPAAHHRQQPFARRARAPPGVWRAASGAEEPVRSAAARRATASSVSAATAPATAPTSVTVCAASLRSTCLELRLSHPAAGGFHPEAGSGPHEILWPFH
eukprot:m.191205 g.191205  ORF g.191205 m.191205 type:complete len:277 (-) comp21721_c0_seq7:4025-4855(-)